MDGRLEFFRRVKTCQKILRTLRETFAGSDELFYGVKAGGALGQSLIRISGGAASGIKIAAGVLIGAFSGLETFLQLDELSANFRDERGDARLLGNVLFDDKVKVLLLLGELAGALAVAFELSEGGFDLRLH